MKKIIKQIAVRFLSIINWIPFRNHINLRGTRLENNNSILSHCKIDCKGRNNIIRLNNARLKNCLIHIYGDNNTIDLDEKVYAEYGEFFIEDSDNKISIGAHTSICGKTHLACIEGTSISIGQDCLFSSEIVLRTGDSHSLLDMSHKRINPSQNIEIGQHVWIGHKVTIQKGALISAHSVIGTGAILTKKFTEQNVVIAGIPARIIKRNINWCGKRIPIKETI